MRTVSLLLTLLVPGCASLEPESAEGVATGEAQLTFERPEIGVMYWNGASCTATLIRDNVVLTAAHCVGFGANDGRGAALGNFIVFRDDEHYHQFAFDAFVSFGHDFNAGDTPANDVALLRLTERVAEGLARPVALATRKPGVDEGVSLFGFGCGDPQVQQDADRGKKQKVSFFHGQTSDLCPGDSGGPTLLDGEGSVFQVNSTGSEVFGDVVLHRASLEAQADAWAALGQAGADAPEQDLTCDGLLGCIEGCGPDVPCRQGCAARTAPTPRRLYDTLTACAQANRCPDLGCVEQACSGQLRECGASEGGEPSVAQPSAGGLTCPELLGCTQQCGADVACAEACRGRASDEATQAYDDYAGCYAANGCQDGDCAHANCSPEYEVCSGPNAPQAADPDGQPDDASEAPDREPHDTDPGPPPETVPRDPPPPELTCREVLQCRESCNDPSCQQDCFFQGRVTAQIAYSALALCGTLHLCADDNCLQLHCAAQYETCITGRYVPPPPRDRGRPGDPCGC